jgi:hypothetical protein
VRKDQSLPPLGFLGLKVLKEMTAIQGLHVRLLLFRAHKDLEEYRNNLEKRQSFPVRRDRPVPPLLRAFRALKVMLVQHVLKGRKVRKVQLALLGLQDLRLHPARRDWIRQYRALQGVKDFRE